MDPKTMMIGIVSRLTDQKGFDLIAYMMEEMCQDGNSADGFWVPAIRNMRICSGTTPGSMIRRFSANIYYSEELSHKIYAACDAFLMPSLFEPCGLSQLMSLRYGTVPIVRETGGLKDTVEPYNEYEGTGTGFSFANYNAHEMLGTIRYAERIYYDRKREWNKIVDRAMAQDYSWGNSARQYQELYDWLALRRLCGLFQIRTWQNTVAGRPFQGFPATVFCYIHFVCCRTGWLCAVCKKDKE